MPLVSSFGALYRAYKKALRGSGKTHQAMAFTFFLETELLQLQKSIVEGTYRPAPYREFQIWDPKKRTISVANFRDRVVHHAVVGVLEPIYERRFIYDSWATRKGKGVHAARERAQIFSRKYCWYLKTDIDQYFASINHHILMDVLLRKIKDKPMLKLINRILKNGGKDGKGLPIGNLTSQFFANVYLDPFDHFVKEQLGVKGYLRYMDDFVLFSSDKHQLKKWYKEIDQYLTDRVMLTLKPTATFLNRSSHGVPFLGARIFPSVMRIKRENLRRLLRRMRRKAAQYGEGILTEDELLASMNGYYAYWESYDSLQLRKHTLAWISDKIAYEKYL